MNIEKRTWHLLLFWGLLLAGIFTFIALFKAILLPFVIGTLIAYFLDPTADRLERNGWSRLWATSVITVCFFGIATMALWVIIPIIASQIQEFVGQIPSYIEHWRGVVDPYLPSWVKQWRGVPMEALEKFGSDAAAMVGTMGLGLMHSGMVLLNLASLLLITPIVSFYLLKDWDRMIARIYELIPPSQAPTIKEQMYRIDRVLAGFLRGQVKVMAILAVYYAITLTIANLNFSILVALLAGFLIIIPYIGTWVTMLLGLGIAYSQGGFDTIFWLVLGIFAVGQVLESQILTPRLVGNSVGLHPLWLIFGMLAGGTLFGFVGVLLAVPLTAVAGVLVRYGIERYLQSPLFLQPYCPPAEPPADAKIEPE